MVIFNIDENFKIQSNWKNGDFKAWLILDANEINNLSTFFHEECIIECIDYKQCQRIDYYSDYIFLLINILEQEEKQIISKEIDIFLSKDYIITVYKSNIKLLDEVIKDISENKNCLLLKEVKDPAIILYYLLDRLIIKNYNIISYLEEDSDKIELDILKEPNSKHLNSLLFIRREAYKLRKLLKPLRYIADSLTLNENGVIKEECLIYFKKLNLRMEKLMAALDILSQELAIVREAYESEIANKTNELMKVFTIITAIFLPLELITALFSMSFDNIPFKECYLGFYVLIILLIVLAVLLLFIFKKKKIL
ncbi:magnesium transporter CorA family protein [Clostridium tarantellae]|uniref:Dihydroorotate dehydrogenase n=1 Tax=Clostridium tarantellae TaxID=39493 RepID=A0A6I1MQX1_9CLOT|nr:magnesium transporter CorA family protein [Clostridium tarantellae]MPQ43281.1 dihydroorotate dehydrogenase [Clostridium tarantellae]